MSAPCECGRYLKQLAAEHDTEVNASPWHDGIKPTAFEEFGMRCPHGVKWHLEPTAEQKLKWARDGVA